MSDQFIHLHNHSDYSIYDGFMSPLEMARRAKELNMSAVAITDHGKVGGFIKFYKACQAEKAPKDDDPKKLAEKMAKHNPVWENSIKPIFGVELYLSHDLSVKKNIGGGKRYHILLLAKNNIGLKNMYKLCSIAHRHTAYNFPRVDFNMLKEYKEGLIISTACMAGEFAQLILEGYEAEAFEMAEKYQKEWGEDFYLEVMYTDNKESKENRENRDEKDYDVGESQVKIIKAAMKCSKKLGIKIIATNDCHYASKGRAKYQQIKKTISSRRPLAYADASEYYMKSCDQMIKMFKGVGREWIHNTIEVADKCNVIMEFGNVELPEFKIPEDESFKIYRKGRYGRNDQQAYLRYIAFRGLKDKGLSKRQKYVDRLKSELETIMFTGFDRYFLIVAEYCEWARNEKIRIGAGRGSGVGSLVLFCLGVTGLDPIKYDLGMDRFLYCEAEYHFGIGDLYSSEEHQEWEPQGRGNRKRKKTEKEKKNFDSLKNICKDKIKDLNLNQSQKERVVEELKFFLKNSNLVDDLFTVGKYKKVSGIGDRNNNNSYILELLGLTSKVCDLTKDFYFTYVVDKEQSRISPPDIDIDFERRDQILKHLCDLYGKDKVALIGTTNTYKPKASIQNAAKALDITNSNNVNEKRFSSENDQRAKELSKIMPNLPGVTLTQFIGDDPKYKPPNSRIEECVKQMKAVKRDHPELIEVALELEGKIRAYGTHAAGVVISSRLITDDVPLHFAKVQRDFDSEIIVDSEEPLDLLTTQYDMDEVEELGLLKFDFLQLQNLRQISEAIRLIEERNGEVDFDIDELETTDPAVFKTINSMKLEGLFQISGDAFTGKDWPMRNKATGETLRDDNGNVRFFHAKGVMEIIGCNSFEDIVAPNSIGRPGPLALDVPTKYAKGKKNPDSIEYPHESLTEILEPTYGQLIYQEQLIEMAQKLAGFTFAEADGLRKACAKKKSEMLDPIEPKFRDGCVKNGIPANVIDEMWNIAVEFGAYAFNKCHSAAYGYITYQTAYLKTYYPAEFISALLTSAASASDEKLDIVTQNLLKEYPKMEIYKPQLNKTKATYYPVSKNTRNIKLIAPFFSLKGIGKKASDVIVSEREKIGSDGFLNMNSFLRTVNSGGKALITNAVGNILIDDGVFDEFGSRSTVREEMIRYTAIKKSTSKGKKNFTEDASIGRMADLFVV